MACCRFIKYYKSLFLGLVDMAIVNGFIIHNFVRRSKGLKEATHQEYMSDLQESLVYAKSGDFANDTRTTVTAPAGRPLIERTAGDHILVQSTETRTHNGVERLLQRACKVCSVYKVSYIVPNGIVMLF